MQDDCRILSVDDTNDLRKKIFSDLGRSVNHTNLRTFITTGIWPDSKIDSFRSPCGLMGFELFVKRGDVVSLLRKDRLPHLDYPLHDSFHVRMSILAREDFNAYLRYQREMCENPRFYRYVLEALRLPFYERAAHLMI